MLFRVFCYFPAHGEAEVGIIVRGVKRVRAQVEDGMPRTKKPLLNLLFEREPAMVRAKINGHCRIWLDQNPLCLLMRSPTRTQDRPHTYGDHASRRKAAQKPDRGRAGKRHAKESSYAFTATLLAITISQHAVDELRRKKFLQLRDLRSSAFTLSFQEQIGDFSVRCGRLANGRRGTLSGSNKLLRQRDRQEEIKVSVLSEIQIAQRHDPHHLPASIKHRQSEFRSVRKL